MYMNHSKLRFKRNGKGITEILNVNLNEIFRYNYFHYDHH